MMKKENNIDVDRQISWEDVLMGILIGILGNLFVSSAFYIYEHGLGKFITFVYISSLILFVVIIFYAIIKLRKIK